MQITRVSPQEIRTEPVAVATNPGSIVTSGVPLARQVEHVLGARALDSPRAGEGEYGFLCTGEPAAFRANGTRFLQLPLGTVGSVQLGRAGGEVAA